MPFIPTSLEADQAIEKLRESWSICCCTWGGRLWAESITSWRVTGWPLTVATTPWDRALLRANRRTAAAGARRLPQDRPRPGSRYPRSRRRGGEAACRQDEHDAGESGAGRGIWHGGGSFVPEGRVAPGQNPVSGRHHARRPCLTSGKPSNFRDFRKLKLTVGGRRPISCGHSRRIIEVS